MSRRIIIVGGPRVGKSTLSERLQKELEIATLRTSAELENLFPVDRAESWSQQSEFASKWFSEDGDWICEGVQTARALRKWLKANPDKSLDAELLFLRQPMVPQSDGQKSMTKGVETVFREIHAELLKRGVRIRELNHPSEAHRGIPMLKHSYKTQEEIPENQRGCYVLSGTEWVLDKLPDDHPLVVNNKALLSENSTQKSSITRLTREKEALEGAALPSGRKAVPEADAEFIEKVKPFGSAPELVTKLTEHKTLKEESDTRKVQDHRREVAKLLGYNPEAFLLLQNLPEFDIRGEGENRTVVAKIKSADNVITEKPGKEFFESATQYAPLMPALTKPTESNGTPVIGSRANAHGSQAADDLIAKRNQAREAERQTNPNPLMPRPAAQAAAK